MSTNTTPTPQELAEAIEELEKYTGSGEVSTEALRTLLAYARAPKNMGWPCDPSQGLMECDKLRAAPRLTEAQREAVKWLVEVQGEVERLKGEITGARPCGM